MSSTPDPINAQGLAELAAVKGQLQVILQLLQAQHDSTQQRIDDMRAAMEQRIDDTRKAMDAGLGGLQERMATLEANERTTAIRTATTSAITSAIVAGGIALLRNVKLGG